MNSEMFDTLLQASGGVGQGDQSMGLAAAVGGIEPEDRRDLAARAP